MNKRGFTLLELLVVVLIIGILASIALPQYQMAVTKAKVASILPLMRRWKDALQEYKLQHGSYEDGNNLSPDADTLGVSWPSDWKEYNTNNPCNDNTNCRNDYWDCMPNAEKTGYVVCSHLIDSRNFFAIIMYQPDEPNHENLAGMTTCESYGSEAEKVCKALGGKLLEDVFAYFDKVYQLN